MKLLRKLKKNKKEGAKKKLETLAETPRINNKQNHLNI